VSINEILEAAAGAIEAKAQYEENRLKGLTGIAYQYEGGPAIRASADTLRQAAAIVRGQKRRDGDEELVPMCESLKEHGRCPD